MRALALLLLAAPASADFAHGTVEGDHVVACYEGCPCLVIAPGTGTVTGTRKSLPVALDIPADPPLTPAAALARCGRPCAALRTYIENDETRTVAVDRAGKLLFEIDEPYGNTWSLVTGKRIAHFRLYDDNGLPLSTSLAHAEVVGRHVLVGEPGAPFTLIYDLYTGAQDQFFEYAAIGHALVVENDGNGRFDLRDFARAGHPRVAVRRIVSTRNDPIAIAMKTVPVGDQTLVLVQEPPVTLLIDPRKRTISRARPLPRCSAPE